MIEVDVKEIPVISVDNQLNLGFVGCQIVANEYFSLIRETVNWDKKKQINDKYKPLENKLNILKSQNKYKNIKKIETEFAKIRKAKTQEYNDFIGLSERFLKITNAMCEAYEDKKLPQDLANGLTLFLEKFITVKD